MIRKSVVALAALLVPAAVAVAASASQPESATVRAGEPTKLFDRAVAKVRAKPRYARAIMLEAEGTLPGPEPGRRAGDVDKWLFALDNQRTDNKYLSVSIVWKRGRGFGKPRGEKSPFLEDLRISRAPKMTLGEAISLMEKAGHRDGFLNVVLRRPIGPSGKPPPLYIFGTPDGAFVAVNTKNGSVTRLE